MHQTNTSIDILFPPPFKKLYFWYLCPAFFTASWKPSFTAISYQVFVQSS